jgi:hypothetical protein
MLKITSPERVYCDLSRVLPITYEVHSHFAEVVATVVRLETGVVLSARVSLRGSQGSLDLRESLDFPWQDGTLLVTFLCRNEVSNRVYIRVETSELTFRDPEVQRFIAQHRRRAGPLPVWPLPGSVIAGRRVLPYYKRMPDSPEVPQHDGIALAVRTTVVHGSFRLPVRDIDIVSRTSRGRDSSRFDYLQTRAVVPISLLITGQEAIDPVQFDLRVPSYSEIDPTGKDRTANGFFAVDLLQMQLSSSRPATGFFYAFSGEGLAGPAESRPS